MSPVDRLICHVLPKAFLMALVAEGRLAELQIVRRDKPSRAESVFLGRLERVMPELDAGFVDIGIGRSGFLRAEDRAGIDDWPPTGAPVLVQVRNDGEGDKGPRLSMNVAVTGRYLVYHPLGSGVSFSRRIEGESERDRLRTHVEGLLEGGVVLRTAAAGATLDVLRADALDVMERWEKLRGLAFDLQPPADLTARMPGERDPIARALRNHGAALEEVVLDDRGMARALQDDMDRLGEKIRVRWHNGPMPTFDIDDVAGQIDTALAPRIVLESGVEVLFEPGETLCAVDVDSAGAGGRQGRAPRRPVEVNLEAAPAIAHQLRLRNIAGAVVIDFVTMRSTYDRDKVQAALAEALAEDPVPTQLYGFTRLGHFELTRARRGATLAAQLEALELPVPAGKPSIINGPYACIGDDPQGAALADGLRLDIQNCLTKMSGLFLVAAFAATALRGAPAADNARRTGVRYALDGTVRRSGEQVRVDVQLLDTIADQVLWSEHYDRVIDDSFRLEDEIAERIVTELDVKLVSGEQARVWRKALSNKRARQHYYEGLQSFIRMNAEAMVSARMSFERVTELAMSAARAELAPGSQDTGS